MFPPVLLFSLGLGTFVPQVCLSGDSEPHVQGRPPCLWFLDLGSAWGLWGEQISTSQLQGWWRGDSWLNLPLLHLCPASRPGTDLAF